jgi:hypothetical protein
MRGMGWGCVKEYTPSLERYGQFHLTKKKKDVDTTVSHKYIYGFAAICKSSHEARCLTFITYILSKPSRSPSKHNTINTFNLFYSILFFYLLVSYYERLQIEVTKKTIPTRHTLLFSFITLPHIHRDHSPPTCGTFIFKTNVIVLEINPI